MQYSAENITVISQDPVYFGLLPTIILLSTSQLIIFILKCFKMEPAQEDPPEIKIDVQKWNIVKWIIVRFRVYLNEAPLYSQFINETSAY